MTYQFGHMPTSCIMFGVRTSSSTITLNITLTAMSNEDLGNQSNSSPGPRSVPPGFTFLRGPDDCEYLVPDFYVGETMFAWDREETMASLKVDSASRKVSFNSIRRLDFTHLILMDH